MRDTAIVPVILLSYCTSKLKQKATETTELKVEYRYDFVCFRILLNDVILDLTVPVREKEKEEATAGVRSML